MTPRQQAIKASAKHYTGKVCPKHPELRGQRRSIDRQCPSCTPRRAGEFKPGDEFFTGRVCWKHPELKGQRRTRDGNCPECAPREQATKAGSMFYTGKVCPNHPELKGQRRVKNRNCPQCIRDRMADPKARAKRHARRKEKRAQGELSA